MTSSPDQVVLRPPTSADVEAAARHRLQRSASRDFRRSSSGTAFYVRNGFIPDGAEQIEDFFGPLEIRMVRR